MSNNRLPEIKTPEAMTAQDMWLFKFQEIQKIETMVLNPLRMRVNSFNPKVLMQYKSCLETYAQQFTEFLYKDYSDERLKIEALFNKFLESWNRAERIKASGHAFIMKGKLNKLYDEARTSLRHVDDILECIRQKKGFGFRENTTFVINERAEKALRINNDVSKQILKLFKKNKTSSEVRGKKGEMLMVNQKADNFLTKTEAKKVEVKSDSGPI